MNFLFDLPRIQNDHDGVWVIVDSLTKTVRFLTIKVTYTLNKLANNRTLLSIVSNKDRRFTSKF